MSSLTAKQSSIWRGVQRLLGRMHRIFISSRSDASSTAIGILCVHECVVSEEATMRGHDLDLLQPTAEIGVLTGICAVQVQ